MSHGEAINALAPWSDGRPTRFSPPEWTKHALCARHDPDMWYPKRGDWRTEDKAKDICNRCPVKEQCLQYATENDEQWGIWGGVNFEKAPQFPCAAGLHEKTVDNVYAVKVNGKYTIGCRDCDAMRLEAA